MQNPILEDEKTPAATGASTDETRQGGTQDLTLRGKADGPAGQAGAGWSNQALQDAQDTPLFEDGVIPLNTVPIKE